MVRFTYKNQRKPGVATLSTELRNKLERIIVQAREVAEAGAKAALEALAVHHHEPYGHMSPEERKLRKHLRARTRQLGDKQTQKGELEITHLVWECAYEHWHRMLFARFLAENDLLIEPDMRVAISLEECEELAKEEGKELWVLASEFAQNMLPQIFRSDNPILQVSFAREHRIKLENLLANLETTIFTSSDSIGWVYQFWQSKRKKEVNQSGNKIGADELPAVTQLFTEPYMVSFLLDNSLGAWWTAKSDVGMGRRGDGAKGILERAETEEEIRKACAIPGVSLEYLRLVRANTDEENPPDHPFSGSPCRTWKPAAGSFKQWPDSLAGFKVIDPCCGSGHFLVAAFLMLVPMRMELEGLSSREACDAVLRENLHGLEIDNRCVELAAFSLALSAWCYPNAGGYRPLPALNVACSGLSVSVAKEEWKQLALGKQNLRIALDWMHDNFKDAPVLGSLLNPTKTDAAKIVQREELSSTLGQALKQEQTDEQQEAAVVAQGLSRAAMLMAGQYHWVITNVPYLARGKQDERLRDFCERHYPAAKNDLATVFLDRCIEMCVERGTASIVLPQNWLFLTSYKKFRDKLLRNDTWHLIARLGEGGFDSSAAAGAFVAMITLSRGNVVGNRGGLFGEGSPAGILRGVDVSELRTAAEKAAGLITAEIKTVEQAKQLENPDAVIALESTTHIDYLGDYAKSIQGLATADDPRFKAHFWEHSEVSRGWVHLQGAVTEIIKFSGRTDILFWQDGKGEYYEHALALKKEKRLGGWKSGHEAWNQKGISIAEMRSLPCTLYTGEMFDHCAHVVIPDDIENYNAIWTFCSSETFKDSVRKINQKLNVTNSTLIKIPFDLDHWTKIAEEKYPNGLSKPYSDDPTQWIFHGHPAQSDEPLHVAVARMLGYRWPAEIDFAMELSDIARTWVKKSKALLLLADEDGIVCIPPVRGEDSAVTRLRELVSQSLDPNWLQTREQELILATGTNASNLDEWLRDHFFEQHCKLFHHRPFIWHIWDGRRRDGFHALVNYHKLAEGNGKGRQLLESLTYSYLGDWITRQKEGVKRGEGGAEDRLAAALELQKRLIAIIEGEPPFDIFVRWKTIEEQSIGWEPDINDGVRLNIRPFMAQDIPGGRKGAGILRWKPNIKWNKDRGKDVASAPWFPVFKGDRINDHHLSLEEKHAARAEANRRGGEPGNG